MQTAAWAMSRQRSMRVSMATRPLSERPFQADAVAASMTTTSRSTKAAVTQAAASGGAESGPIRSESTSWYPVNPKAMMMMPFSEAVDWNMEIDSRIVAFVCCADETEASPSGIVSFRGREEQCLLGVDLRDHRLNGGCELVDDDCLAAGQACGPAQVRFLANALECEGAIRPAGSRRTGHEDRDRTAA